jgi:UDP-N-acetylmuramyl tripeptide synthase
VAVKLRTRAALVAGQAAAGASRLLGRGAGEVVGGKVARRIDPDVLRELAVGRPLITVSGTNGKTTTTRLLTAALATRGPVVTNGGGANMPPGVITALAAAATDASVPGVLEVDELHLPAVAAAVQPRVAALLNLSRDQLDRANETRRIAGLWREAGAELPYTRAVANADDPLVVWAAEGFADVTWVGAGQVWTSDAMVCPRCANLLRRERHGDHGVRWWCPSCGLERPKTEVDVAGLHALVVDGAEVPLALALPGRCNVANAAVAVAAAAVLGIPAAESVPAMEAVDAVAGRYSTVTLGGRSARMLLAKNPAGWVEMLELLEEGPVRPVVVHFHAREADGRDPSWIYDVPAGRLAGRPVLVSGDRAEDLATRLAYAGVATTVSATPAEAAAAAPGEGEIDVLATYTAFRELLVESGVVAG